jgi:Ca2+-binding RTX toxin-like protein
MKMRVTKLTFAPRIEPLERRQLLCGHGMISSHAMISGHGNDNLGNPAQQAKGERNSRNGIVSFTGGSGIDWIFVSADASTVTVQFNGVDYMYDRSQVKGINLNGGAGDDTILVMDLDNTFDIPVTMNGGLGMDDLEGGNERDAINGGGGDDFMFGNGGNDVMVGGDGNDVMNAGSGNDVMMGGYGDDQMGGGEGDDYLYGNAGNDFLYGEDGDDHLSGGRGTDYVEGDAGADTFASNRDMDAERVMDDLDTVVARFARPVM